MFEEELGGGSIGGSVGGSAAAAEGVGSDEGACGGEGEGVFSMGGRGRDMCTGFDHAEMAQAIGGPRASRASR